MQLRLLAVSLLPIDSQHIMTRYLPYYGEKSSFTLIALQVQWPRLCEPAVDVKISQQMKTNPNITDTTERKRRVATLVWRKIETDYFSTLLSATKTMKSGFDIETLKMYCYRYTRSIMFKRKTVLIIHLFFFFSLK